MPVEGAGGGKRHSNAQAGQSGAKEGGESGGHLGAAPKTQACGGKRGAAWQEGGRVAGSMHQTHPSTVVHAQAEGTRVCVCLTGGPHVNVLGLSPLT